MKRQMRKKQSTKSLRQGVFHSFMIFALLLIGLLWILQIVLLENFYKQIKTQNLKSTADNIVAAALGNDSVHSQTILSAATELAVKNEISIEIIDCSDSNSEYTSFQPVFSIVTDQDNVLYMLRDSELYFIYDDARENGGELLQTYQRVNTSHPLWKEKHQNKDQDKDDLPVNAPSNDDTQTEHTSSDTDGTQTATDGVNEYAPRSDFEHGAPPFFKTGITQELLYARVVTLSDGHEYMMLFDGVITPIGTTVKTLKVQLIIVTMIIALIAACMARWLSRRIAEPIAGINSSAMRLASGNFDTKFSGGDYLEINQLSDTLNYTARELKEADAVKRELIANTSHDLRTPLTMIIGYAEVMRDLPGENTPENVQVIIDEAKRLTTLVNDMLDLSKLQAGAVALEISEFNITKITESIVERMRKMTEKDGFDFRFEYENPIFVKADEVKITQVIYNFLSNAVNYSEDNRDILIRQTSKNGMVRLEFVDHGRGIPKEKLPNIWERYYKIDSTHKRSQIGSGVGLSIVKSILEKHGARYGVVSNTVAGSTFWFELPISEEIT